MFIIWGLVSTIVAVVFEFILLQIPFSIHNQSLSFIIPAGGFMDGALCASGLYLNLRIKSLRLKPKHFIYGLLFAFIGFWSIYYMSFQTLYIYDNSINHAFHGEKITNFMYNDTERLNFGNYLRLIINNISFKSVDYLGAPIEINNFRSKFNTAVFVSECIGFCLGGLSISTIALRNKNNCKKCRDLLNSKKLYIFRPEDLNVEIDGLQNSFSSKDNFKAFIYKNRETLKDGESYVEVFLKYCNNCNLGFIEYRYMKPVNKANNDIAWIEDEDKYKQIVIPSDKFKIVTGI